MIRASQEQDATSVIFTLCPPPTNLVLSLKRQSVNVLAEFLASLVTTFPRGIRLMWSRRLRLQLLQLDLIEFERLDGTGAET